MDLKFIFSKVNNNEHLSIEEIIYLLKTQDEDLKALYTKADQIRSKFMGDEVFLRGIIEFSNHCKKDCNYCGIRKNNLNVNRYRMNEEEIVELCKNIEKNKQTTVVLQSGEDPLFGKERIGNLVKIIKKATNLAVTLSVGEHPYETYEYWAKKGMDRYLLRFETSNPKLFEYCHPDDNLNIRIKCLKNLKELGVQTGSGLLIGLPNETYEQLANDIIFCTDLSLDMIGIGPFIPHEETPFDGTENPFDKEIYFKVISILRLMNKKAHIPSTTAFDAIDPQGRNLLLQRGANVFMPNATPAKYRADYLLYPGKPCLQESGDDCAACVVERIKRLGREVGKGPGHSIRGMG